MARVLEHREAVRLRLQGKSYNEILRKVHVAKSSLSEWLHCYPLNETQLKR